MAVLVDLGNTKLFWVLNMTQQDLCGGCSCTTGCTRCLKLVHKLGEPLLEHVVAQVHHKVFVAQEVVRNQYAMCKPQRRVLGDVGDLDPELRAITNCCTDLFARLANNDANFLDPRLGHGLDAVKQNRFVGNRHQLFGAGVGDGPEARSRTARQDEALHIAYRLGDGETNDRPAN